MRALWLVLVLFLMPYNVQASCRLGQDGNWHTNEDPFVDAANHDFRLKPGSCAVDHGATIPEVKTDIDGIKRPSGKGYDIGAHELLQIQSPENFSLRNNTPALLNPSPGTTLTTSTMTFQWSADSGVNEYYLGVGTSQTAVANAPWGNIFAASAGIKTSQFVAGIPLTGDLVYVRLWWKIGTKWFYTDSTYQTQKDNSDAIHHSS